MHLKEAVEAERTEAERTEAERTEAERTEAERTEAERCQVAFVLFLAPPKKHGPGLKVKLN
jgi:hypothetical protein